MLKRFVLPVFIGLSLVGSVSGEVRVYVEDNQGTALIKYECSVGEVVRAFALDVYVDRGQIVGISDFFRGESRPGATGYGIFPASFRDYIPAGAETNVDWNVSGYTPLANPADAPSATLPGLNSSGVTLEFGALWNPAVPEAVPGPSGTLCALRLSGPARVTISPNAIRGGVVPAQPDNITTAFSGAVVGPAITSFSLTEGVVNILFQGGELQTATSLDGPWTNTGNRSGEHSELVGGDTNRFFRVRGDTSSSQ